MIFHVIRPEMRCSSVRWLMSSPEDSPEDESESLLSLLVSSFLLRFFLFDLFFLLGGSDSLSLAELLLLLRLRLLRFFRCAPLVLACLPRGCSVRGGFRCPFLRSEINYFTCHIFFSFGNCFSIRYLNITRLLTVLNQCCGSMTIWDGSRSGSADPCL
jgi:hypothetical protein